ncbi:hypothetical protein EN45_094320 [Penicillium chrysogenum]|uniref:Protein kinase domain-containing protein n=1 Tax=Penicillium chrysogenum TaxID=5076 RepID=A0A167QWD0_PENCH|nr:hypothetical protein EN45_094320 [Penicillium chrysogenum]
MAPQITSWDDLNKVWEQGNDETGEAQQTSFALFDSNESFYYGMLETPKAEITFDQVTKALSSVPDEEVFTRWPVPGIELIQAPATLTEDLYIKRPDPEMYKVLKEHNALSQLSAALLAEAEVLQSLSQNPHPNIIRYHGCRVLRGYFMGIVIDKHPYDLHDHLKNRVGTIEKRSFIAALESALRHLHTRGLAHNDLTPQNILSMPRLTSEISTPGLTMRSNAGRCPTPRFIFLKVNLLLWVILSRNSAILLSPSTTSKKASASPCFLTVSVNCLSSSLFLSSAAPFRNEKTKLMLFQVNFGVAFAMVASLILLPGKVTTQPKGFENGFVWISNNGNPDESRSSRQERPLYFRPVAVNAGEPSLSEILYA